MTLNLRRAVPLAVYKEWFHFSRQWWRRAPLVKRMLAAERPDILCLQEATIRQVQSLVSAFPRFRFAARPRSELPRDETTAVLWDERRFTGSQEKFFWLSDRPTEPGSRSWGNRLPRMLTLVQLTDRETGQTIKVVNVHLDNRSISARHRGARLISNLADAADMPVIVTGDFNDGPGAKTHTIATGGGLRDSWNLAVTQVSPEWKTFNGWNADPSVQGSRIDWILVSPEFSVEKTGINTFSKGSRTPSDHWSVQAVLHATQ